ncbi:MAG TPA: hypothetical protein VF533_01300, partial [Solirubrobacteraceae bacterium]
VTCVVAPATTARDARTATLRRGGRVVASGRLRKGVFRATVSRGSLPRGAYRFALRKGAVELVLPARLR